MKATWVYELAQTFTIRHMDRQTSQLVHYTASPEIVASILTHGFLLVPNKRFLINALLGEDLFDDREPQEYGMVSFTQLPVNQASLHRQNFGPFGLVVTWEWALGHDAQRVTYVDMQGPVASEFAWLFRFARQEYERAAQSRVDARDLENKAAASFARSTVWSRLLTLYEYMEPERNSAQVEWRIVNELPQYHSGSTRAEVVSELLASAKRWRNIGSVRVTPNDVVAFVSPRGKVDALRQALPKEFADVPVQTYREAPSLSRYEAVHERALQTHKVRTRVVTVVEPPTEDSFRVSRSFDSTYYMPAMERLQGVKLHQDELAAAAQILMQYTCFTGALCGLLMPIAEAFRVHNALRELQWYSGLDPLNPLDEHDRPRDLIIGKIRMGVRPVSPHRRGR